MCLFLQFWLKFCRGGDKRQPANFRREISQPAKIFAGCCGISKKLYGRLPHIRQKCTVSLGKKKFYFQKSYIYKKIIKKEKKKNLSHIYKKNSFFLILFFKKKKNFAVCKISQRIFATCSYFRNSILFSSYLFHSNSVLGVFGTVGNIREFRIKIWPERTILKLL